MSQSMPNKPALRKTWLPAMLQSLCRLFKSRFMCRFSRRTSSQSGCDRVSSRFAFRPQLEALENRLTPAGLTSVDQWATSVSDFSSQYSSSSWSAAQATAAPDTFAYGDVRTAWAVRSRNDGEHSITLGYDSPVNASGVTVRETNGNGFVTRIDLRDTNGAFHTVWTGTDTSAAGAPADFKVSFKATPYLVKGVRVYIDTEHDQSSWEEIDAVQLHGVYATPASVLASLSDPGIKALAQKDYLDGSLSRNDMIGIFNQVARQGNKVVDATELMDLHTLVDNATVLMPQYVEKLATKVIDYNLANRHFQGKVLLPSGQLAAGQSGTKLTTLVDKWFRGRDVPKAMDPYGRTYSYASASGRLFGAHGPNYQDVHQGQVGDCYFVASLSAAVARAPMAIKNMFINNGDGTFTVRFFNCGVVDYVTVNRQLPVDEAGRFIFAGQGQSAGYGGNILWANLAEKAYAQLAEEGWSRAWFANPANSYSSINGGRSYITLAQITGRSAWAAPVNSRTTGELITALKYGTLVTIGTKYSEPENSHVIPRHVYYVTGYDAGAKTFTVVNPWGADLPTIGTLHLTARQMQKYFSEFDVAAA